MKININLSKLPPKYDDAIFLELEECGLPGCFGNMVLPILENYLTIDSDKLLTLRNMVAPEDIAVDDIMPLTSIPSDIAKTHVVDKQHYFQIESFKKERIKKYVAQALRCSKCEYVDTCFKLTQNYLLAVK